MGKKISYEPHKNSTNPYHIQKQIPDSNEWYPGRRYNERGIRSYITTATKKGIELDISDDVPRDISEFIESQKNKWNRIRVLEQKV